MKKQWQVVLAGEGGQGLVFIGALLGEAAVKENRFAAQAASYTIASRGGFTKADVVIDEEEISFPGVVEPDVVLALSAGALAKYRGSLPPQCMLVYDSCLEDEGGGSNRVPLPLSDTVRQGAAAGRKFPLNLVALGAVVALTGMVSWDALREALTERFPAEKSYRAGWDALQAGAVLVKNTI